MNQWKRTLERAGTFILIASALSACGTFKGYPGDELPVEQTAIVQGSGFLINTVRIATVDGEGLGLSSRFSVLPGLHKVNVYFSTWLVFSSAEAWGLLTIDTQAGYTYTVLGTMEIGGAGGTAKFRVESAPTKK